MQTFTTLGASKIPTAMKPDIMQKFMSTYTPDPGEGAGPDYYSDNSAYTAPTTSSFKMQLLFALLAGGATYYTLTQTPWGAKMRGRIGL